MIGTQFSGRYRLEAKLGSGGMSTVYLATDETLGRKVAIKVLHREISDQPDQIERFRREARAVASLSHPNLVAVIDAGEDAGHPYIVFEYVPGETLKKRIDEEGGLPLDEATAYAIEIGRGLACAHGAGLVHRDVKPQNVLIDADGRAKTTDFGIARSMEEHGLTATGRVLGTTDYVSPEQAMGQDIDDRSDIYSLGIVLFEMLTGDVPFHAETQVGVAMKHVNEVVPNVQRMRPQVSAALAAALERATAKDPRERYPDMNSFLADLENALEVEVSRAGRSTGEATTVLASVPSKHKLLTRRRISWAGALLLLAAAAAALAIAAVTGEEGPSRQAPAVTDPGGEELPVAEAIDYDPPPGDEQEYPERTGAAIDGDPRGTAWTTEGYDSPDFFGDKTGVGLILDAEEDVTPSELALVTGTPGWEAEIYGSAGASYPDDPDGWGDPLAGPVPVDSRETAIELNALDSHRFFLIWITRLPEEADSDGRHRVTISDAALIG